jgi:hypothetical protein
VPGIGIDVASGRSCADERLRCGGVASLSMTKTTREIGKAARPVHDATVVGRIAAHRRGNRRRRSASPPFLTSPLAMNQPESFVTLAASVGAPAYVRHPGSSWRDWRKCLHDHTFGGDQGSDHGHRQPRQSVRDHNLRL